MFLSDKAKGIQTSVVTKEFDRQPSKVSGTVEANNYRAAVPLYVNRKILMHKYEIFCAFVHHAETFPTSQFGDVARIARLLGFLSDQYQSDADEV